MYSNTIDINSSLAGFGIGLLAFFGFLVLAILVMAIIGYIFQSLAFYKFMQDRNLDNAFLAWIPVVRAYTIGKVYDDINEKQGKKTNFSIILLILNCAYWAYLLGLSKMLDISFLGVGVSLGLPIAIFVLQLICYNLIFKTYTPNNSSYFVLTVIFSIIILVPFTPGLCLLKASKNQPVAESKIDN